MSELVTTPTRIETQAPKVSALAVMASRVSVDPDKLLQTLKDTVFKGASNSELLALVVVSNEYDLNPLLKEIYAFPAKGGGIVPVVSVDGWIKMINRQPTLDGMKLTMSSDGEECTCQIFIKGRSHPVEATEYKAECFRATDPWKTMPRRMLRHKAIIQAARIAFGFSGIHDDDEGRDIVTRTAPKRIEAVEVPIDPFTEPAAVVAIEDAPLLEEEKSW